MSKEERKKKFAAALAATPGESGESIVGRLWIERGGETIVSWARITLLERIDETGSISAAARMLGISYTKAWRMVKDMNAHFGAPLVANTIGGPKGGGAALTQEGREVVARFRDLVERFKQWLSEQTF